MTWVKLSEELPPSYMDVLLTGRYERIKAGYLEPRGDFLVTGIGDHNWHAVGGPYSHWMRIPEDPEFDDDGGSENGQ